MATCTSSLGCLNPARRRVFEEPWLLWFGGVAEVALVFILKNIVSSCVTVVSRALLVRTLPLVGLDRANDLAVASSINHHIFWLDHRVAVATGGVMFA